LSPSLYTRPCALYLVVYPNMHRSTCNVRPRRPRSAAKCSNRLGCESTSTLLHILALTNFHAQRHSAVSGIYSYAPPSHRAFVSSNSVDRHNLAIKVRHRHRVVFVYDVSWLLFTHVLRRSSPGNAKGAWEPT
jgi:hypothetical protein